MIKYNTINYKILTDNGYKSFDGIQKLPISDIYEVLLNTKEYIRCTIDHKLATPLGLIPLSELTLGDVLITDKGHGIIQSITQCQSEEVYDVLEVEGNQFYCNDILVSNCEFVGKSNTLIDTMILRQLVLAAKDTTYSFVIDSDIRFYENLNPYRKYLISIDTGMGIEGDFSSIQVFEFPGFKQIAEWKSDRLNQNDQIEKMKNLTEWMYTDLKNRGNRQPSIYWSLENNGSAEGFICALREKSASSQIDINTGYIRRAKLISERGNKRIGFTTTSANKNIACSQLKIMIETNQMKIKSKDYLSQLGTFTGNYASRSYSAKGGNNDDLISASLNIILMYLQEKNNLDLDIETTPLSREMERSQDLWDDGLPFLYN